MKKRYNVEFTTEQIAFVIRMLDHRIQKTADETAIARTVIAALIDATPQPEPIRLAQPRRRKATRTTATAIGRHPLRTTEREKAQ